MFDVIDLGPTPNEEQCAQVGAQRFDFCARLECNTYIAALIANYGIPPPGAKFFIKRHPHRSAEYYEVQLRYDPMNGDHTPYAELIDGGLSTWRPLCGPMVYSRSGAPTVVYLTAHDAVLNTISNLEHTTCVLLAWQRENLIAAYPRAARDAGVIDEPAASEPIG
jgi:hypothetical protein